MATKTEKKETLRTQIIDAAKIYSKELAGKVFLYVVGNEYFEVSFPVDHFLHLTGVESQLSAKNFYTKSKDGILSDRQFYFSPKHPYDGAKKKLPCLKRLPDLTSGFVCVLKETQTVSIVYKLSVTNLEFTLGLTENIDAQGNKINDIYLPRTLRVKDRSIENSLGGDVVDFIFKKEASTTRYTELVVADEKKVLPDCLYGIVADCFFEHDEPKGKS